MKKFLILGVLAVSGWLVSCEEEEVPGFVQRDYLQGDWAAKQTGELVPFNNGSQVVNIVEYTDVENDPACNVDGLMLKADGTFALNDFENVGGSCQNNGISGTYSRTDNRIFLNYMVGATQRTLIMNVSVLTYTELHVSYPDLVTNDLVFVKYTKPASAN
jgi:hypothetical protein